MKDKMFWLTAYSPMLLVMGFLVFLIGGDVYEKATLKHGNIQGHSLVLDRDDGKVKSICHLEKGDSGYVHGAHVDIDTNGNFTVSRIAKLQEKCRFPSSYLWLEFDGTDLKAENGTKIYPQGCNGLY